MHNYKANVKKQEAFFYQDSDDDGSVPNWSIEEVSLGGIRPLRY